MGYERSSGKKNLWASGPSISVGGRWALGRRYGVAKVLEATNPSRSVRAPEGRDEAGHWRSPLVPRFSPRFQHGGAGPNWQEIVDFRSPCIGAVPFHRRRRLGLALQPLPSPAKRGDRGPSDAALSHRWPRAQATVSAALDCRVAPKGAPRDDLSSGHDDVTGVSRNSPCFARLPRLPSLPFPNVQDNHGAHSCGRRRAYDRHDHGRMAA